jgi:hypothetical protein
MAPADAPTWRAAVLGLLWHLPAGGNGRHEELITSGASTSWHDLVLYLIARHVGSTAAQQVARALALQWH